jgi:hypothetical protein
MKSAPCFSQLATIHEAYWILYAYLLANHVHRVLDSAIWDDGDNRRINNTKILDAVNAQLGVNHTLLDALGQTGCTARVYHYRISIKSGES